MKILWFVSTIEDTNFLRRFAKHYDGDIDVFHLNFITYFDLITFKGTHILPKWKKEYRGLNVEPLNKCFNLLSGRLSVEEGNKAYQATLGILNKYLQENSSVYFMIPSGRHVHHIAAAYVANKQKIKTLYINYSNFPGYTFFDPEGTDCKASIYRDTSILNPLGQESVDVVEVFDRFSKLKNLQKSIPQKKATGLNSFIKNIAFYGDTLFQITTGVIGDRRRKLSLKVTNKESVLINVKSTLPGKAFFFFPLQVSTDQQVLINYEKGSIFEAINEAFELAKSEGKVLVVREHPAEGNVEGVRAYLSEMQTNNLNSFYISTLPVSELINKAEKIITINSTVGLESRINRKPVVFLGHSFYQKASDIELATYLDSYLIKVDYHDCVFTKKINNAIMNRF